LGYYAGVRVAFWRVNRLELNQSPEVVRLNAKLDVLAKIEMLKTIADARSDANNDAASRLADALQQLGQTEPDHEMKQVIHYETGLAHINAAACAERSADVSSARDHMKQAQRIFAELGWKDTSEATLRLLATQQDKSVPRRSRND
jgi:hypothetical protein